MKYTAENRVNVGAAGGIEAVMKAVNIHFENPDGCKAGCDALISMIVNS